MTLAAMPPIRTCRCGKPLVLITYRSWAHADGNRYRHLIKLAEDQTAAPTLGEDARELRRIALGMGDLSVRAVLEGIAGRLDAPAPVRQERTHG